MVESYASAIQQHSPQKGPQILNARYINTNNATERIVSWIHDYAQLQVKHANELERFLSKHIISERDLGTLAQPWQTLASYVVELTTAETESAKRTKIESEKPIKDLTKFNQLESVVHDLQSNPSPELIYKFEQLDEQRLATIKACVARLATIEQDKAHAQTANAEKAIAAWLQYEPKDDLQAFIAQIVSGQAPATNLSANLTGGNDALVHANAAANDRNASAGTRKASNASSTSNSTVKRRSSLLFLKPGQSNSDEKQHSSLRAKVGSIFGRKKERSASGRNLSAASHPNLSNSAKVTTNPPDFGLRQPSSLSVHSLESQSSSIRPPRQRTEDEVHVPSPLRGNAALGMPRNMPPQLESSPKNDNFKPLNSNDSKLGPSALPPSFPGSNVKLVPTNLSKSDLSAQPVQQQQQMQPPVQQVQQPLSAQLSGTVHSIPENATDTTSHTAPAPPPSRNNRNSIVGVTSSQGPMQRVSNPNSLSQSQRQQRVASHLFVNLNPATESNRDSMAPTDNENLDLNLNMSMNDEVRDQVSSLRETPQHVPGTPDQFFTPAQKFPQQFTNFHDLGSTTSLVTSGTIDYPQLPEETGLVSAIVEYISAEFEGDKMVKSSLDGHAICMVRTKDEDPIPETPISLGILLIDPNAKLTPCPLLKQISDLSFDMPPASYLHPQELCSYTSDNADARFPISLMPMWRIEGTTARLVISYQMLDKYIGSDEIEVSNLVIYVNVKGNTKAKSAMSKPMATFSREKQRVTWRMPDSQILKRGVQGGKLLCQFTMESEGAEPGPVHISARIQGVQNSVLQLRQLYVPPPTPENSVAPPGEWVPVPANVASTVSAERR